MVDIISMLIVDEQPPTHPSVKYSLTDMTVNVKIRKKEMWERECGYPEIGSMDIAAMLIIWVFRWFFCFQLFRFRVNTWRQFTWKCFPSKEFFGGHTELMSLPRKSFWKQQTPERDSSSSVDNTIQVHILFGLCALLNPRLCAAFVCFLSYLV